MEFIDVCALTKSKFRDVLINKWILPYVIAAMLVDAKQQISPALARFVRPPAFVRFTILISVWRLAANYL